MDQSSDPISFNSSSTVLHSFARVSSLLKHPGSLIITALLRFPRASEDHEELTQLRSISKGAMRLQRLTNVVLQSLAFKTMSEVWVDIICWSLEWCRWWRVSKKKTSEKRGGVRKKRTKRVTRSRSTSVKVNIMLKKILCMCSTFLLLLLPICIKWI